MLRETSRDPSGRTPGPRRRPEHRQGARARRRRPAGQRRPGRAPGRPGLASLLLIAVFAVACRHEAEPPLLLLITTDTLRADHVGAYGGPGRRLELTPHLDALAREGLRFERAFAPASYTLPSMAALLTGRYPEEVGIFANRSLFRGTSVTLAEVLRLAGWKTGAVVSNYVLRAGTGIEIGFDHYDDAFTQREANRDQPEREARGTTDAALAMFDSLRAQPAAGHLLWVHYQDPHGPYLPPAGLRERYLPAALEASDGARRLPSRGINPVGAIPSYQLVGDERRVAFYRAGYAGEVAFTDAEIGRLLDGLQARGALDAATIVFTADHGESLGEDDYWFAHGELLSDPLVRVPLWIRAPAIEAGTRHDLASLVDLFPTLLGLFEIGVPSQTAGRNLLAARARQAEPILYMATLLGSSTERRGIVAGEHRYVASRQADGSLHERLERLDGAALEAGAEATLLESSRVQLAKMRASLRVPRGHEAQSLSPEDLEMLRRLGYAE